MPSEAELFDSLLACPRCDRVLERSGTGYKCSGCSVDFPVVGGVPCLFAEPQATLLSWRERFGLLALTLEREAATIEAALSEPALRSSTRQRLEALKAALEDHRARLEQLLAPLGGGATSQAYETALALRTRLPPTQGINTYYANAHRDWAWGSEENVAAFAALERVRDGASFGATLVLGAGAARLAYDIHLANRAAPTIALDFNPLLMLAARRIASGDSLELYEFPIAPRHTADQAVLRTLRAPAPAGSELGFIIADALRAPLRRASLQTVVTPWLVDIVDDDFALFCRRVNGLLEPDGQWLNFGSLSFHDRSPARCYSLEECREIVADAGFDISTVEEATIPYMRSPASRHGRMEEVVVWRAVKRRDAGRVPRWVALPDWIVKGDAPVPLLPEFQQQTLSTRIYAYIMSLIDGRRTLRDMAKILEQQKILSAGEAEPTLRSFLTKMYDESRTPRRY